MSISWVGCQSKMDVPFNRFLCLQTSKRDTLSAFLWGVPFPRLKMQKTIKKDTHSIAHRERERERERERKRIMSISWVGCQSKMDVPFNRFLCLQTSKRDTLSAFLWGVPFPRLKMQKTIKKDTHSIAHIYIYI